jgi:hypothetical protein
MDASILSLSVSRIFFSSCANQSSFNLQSYIYIYCAELVLGLTDAYMSERGPVVKPTETERKQTQMELFDTMETGSTIPPIGIWLFEQVKMSMSMSAVGLILIALDFQG